MNPVLPSGNSSYLGVLDLGGASTQITYSLPADTTWSDENSTEKVELFSNQLTLYSNSFLCFGVNEMKGQLYAILAKVCKLVFLIDGRKHPPDFTYIYQVSNISLGLVTRS